MAVAQANSDEIFLEGVVETVHFPPPGREKDKNEPVWSVFTMVVTDGRKTERVKCSGEIPPVNEDECLVLAGEWADTQYGRQFKFRTASRKMPRERGAVSAFLAKHVNGIGPAIAGKIVDAFGPDAIDKILADKSVLESISGISAKRATMIWEQLNGMSSSLEEMKFFAMTRLGSAKIADIRAAYSQTCKTPEALINKIKRNPYQLIEDVKGIGFRTADAVALNIGMERTDEKRLKAGLLFVLEEEVDGKGNVWMAKDSLTKTASSTKYLDVPEYLLQDMVKACEQEGKLKVEQNRVYLSAFFQMEHVIAKRLRDILVGNAESVSQEQGDTWVSEIQKQKGRSLDDGQKEAVINSLQNSLSIITGGPGVGKTTTLDVLLTILEEKMEYTIISTAPTGRAAKRMTEQTGRPAMTIDKMCLTHQPSNGKLVYVVDESSMVDMNTVSKLLGLVQPGNRLIFVGDVDQLPSIGPGQILRDMIDSGKIPLARLTKIHRQGADSHIITNAHLCIAGKHLEKEAHKDMFIAERDTDEKCIRTIMELVTKAYPDKTGTPAMDVQILAPLKKGPLGIIRLNQLLQEQINPGNPWKKQITVKRVDEEVVLREGDKVIQQKNDYDVITDSTVEKGVYNGEIGIVESIRDSFGLTMVAVKYASKRAVYDKKQLQNLSLAYCITIHKSQGSEFPAVIIPLLSYGMPTIYNRNLLYTAITRAKKYCCIVGSRSTTNKMIHNSRVNKRNTTLSQRIQEVM